MANLNEIQLLLFVSLMIFPAAKAPEPHALKPLYLSLMTFSKHFVHETCIVWSGQNFTQTYIGGGDERIYTAKPNTTKVIVYMMNSFDTHDIMAAKNADKRMDIFERLEEKNYELLYMEVANFILGDQHPICDFLSATIKPDENQSNFTIETIGRKLLNVNYASMSDSFGKYEEDPAVCGGDLQGLLHSFSSRREDVTDPNSHQSPKKRKRQV